MNKQIAALFLCNFAILFVGFGVFPLLPVYAARFGASPAMVGVYLALTYIAISVGNMLPGWLNRRVSPQAVFVTAGFLGVPALMLLGAGTGLLAGGGIDGCRVVHRRGGDRPRGRVLVTSIENPSLATATEVLSQSALVAEDVFPILLFFL